MAEHKVGGETVVVTTRSRNFFFYRSQGVSIEVSPDRHWWCLWLCSSTTSIDVIQCSITLSGLASEADANGQCSDCGSLNVMGPSFWGVNVPQPFERVTYNGVVQIKGERFPFSGLILYTT